MPTEFYSPPTCPSRHPSASFLHLSKWHHIYSVIQTGNDEATFGSSLSLTQTFYSPLRPSPKYISSSSTLLHCFSLGHHHLSPEHGSGLPNGFLVCILLPANSFSRSLHNNLFFPCIYTHIHFLLSCVSFKQISDILLSLSITVVLYVCVYII